MATAVRKVLLVVLLAALPLVACAQDRPRNAIAIKFGDHTLWAEVADDDAERTQGLMFRREMGKDVGMIFVFEFPQPASFWMRNTPLPLSIAFLDEKRRVLNIEKMQPYDDRHYHHARGMALYAVEAHQGWFESRGIKAGDVAEFELPAKDPKKKRE